MNVANLRNVGTGLNKDQLYELIGPPQFHEWFVGSHVWNYLFDFRRGDTVVSCQYQIQFDRNMRVSATYWRDPQCADFVRDAAPAASVAAGPAPLEQFTIGGEALFPFAKSSVDSMLPGGRAELDAAIAKIRAEASMTNIDVVGHTDRIGSDESNHALALARAETVKRYLVTHGIDAARIRAEGVGSSQPVSHCPPGETPAVISCLQKDRRVTITVYGQR
ncbi:OmpA family protein [Burkholderia sp. AU45388]|uniref:OmpA family protein n=1 Tax=Burkholderia sp. AU45388 TaxID=3059206 RepID=UPI0026563346|nr:OmpA family protein [Burkholderia sp. AU45388]MDN7425264.1 OmpA family protein [Burkholderia sp. AU45388]